MNHSFPQWPDAIVRTENVSRQRKARCAGLVASLTGELGSVTVHQDVRLYAGLFDGQEQATLDLDAGRLAYVHVVRGSIGINGTQLAAGDAVKLTDEQRVEVAEGIDAEVLVFDLTPFPRV